MSARNLVPRAFRLAAIVGACTGGLAAGSPPVFAQQTTATPAKPIQEIVIVAPRVSRQVVGRAATGAMIEVLSVTRQISYADLDLTKESAAAELEARIKDAAKKACDEVNRKYPDKLYPPVPADQDCVKSATDGAMIVAKTLIAAANIK